jgi:hypothetical protein
VTPQGKLKLLLVRQFVYVVVVLTAVALPVVWPDVGIFAAIALLIAVGRFGRPVERTLRETEVRLTRTQKHIYFGTGLVYFFAVVSIILCYAVHHSTRPVWSLTGLVLVILLVFLYAGADLVYRAKSRV